MIWSSTIERFLTLDKYTCGSMDGKYKDFLYHRTTLTEKWFYGGIVYGKRKVNKVLREEQSAV